MVEFNLLQCWQVLLYIEFTKCTFCVVFDLVQANLMRIWSCEMYHSHHVETSIVITLARNNMQLSENTVHTFLQTRAYTFQYFQLFVLIRFPFSCGNVISAISSRNVCICMAHGEWVHEQVEEETKGKKLASLNIDRTFGKSYSILRWIEVLRRPGTGCITSSYWMGGISSHVPTPPTPWHPFPLSGEITSAGGAVWGGKIVTGFSRRLPLIATATKHMTQSMRIPFHCYFQVHQRVNASLFTPEFCIRIHQNGYVYVVYTFWINVWQLK